MSNPCFQTGVALVHWLVNKSNPSIAWSKKLVRDQLMELINEKEYGQYKDF